MAKWTDTGKMTAAQAIDMPPVWLIGFLILTWISKYIMSSLTYPLGITRLLGGLLALCGVLLMFWAIATFRVHQTSVVPHQTPARIITSGPFARSRNPIYLADVMILTGTVFWWGAWPALVLIPIFSGTLTRRFIAPEEARMKDSFGMDFDAFVQKTPRWL